MYQTEVKFHKLPIFDLLVEDAQGLSVFGSDYNAAGLVGDIHQNLCPLARLGVFVSNIVH